MKRAGRDWRRDKAWRPVAHPPEIYVFVLLAFADGTTGRGTWNGKLWWGYDEKTRKPRTLHPKAWRPLEG